MVNTQLIGLYSSLPMSGKSSAAAALTAVNWKRLPFAGTLKRMLRVLLLDLGQSEQEVEHALSDQKELPCVLLPGHTPRQLLQTLGTQWGRELVDEELWVKCWMGQATNAIGDGFSIVADDVRRTNEAEAIRHLGGVMVKVVRPGGGSDTFSDHASEGGLEDWPFDHTLINDGSISDLQRQVLALVDTLNQQRSNG